MVNRLRLDPFCKLAFICLHLHPLPSPTVLLPSPSVCKNRQILIHSFQSLRQLLDVYSFIRCMCWFSDLSSWWTTSGSATGSPLLSEHPSHLEGKLIQPCVQNVFPGSEYVVVSRQEQSKFTALRFVVWLKIAVSDLQNKWLLLFSPHLYVCGFSSLLQVV